MRHHNLKNINLDLPLGKLIVITGLSGSGKSTLAFDTLYAEGQRRYIETFSPYARQFFDRMDKPQADSIQGIPPAIAIQQRNAVKSTRSTIGTMTEIADYMKLLWAHFAQLHCRGCGEPVLPEPPQRIWEAVRQNNRSRPNGVVSKTGAGGAELREAAVPFVTEPELMILFSVALSEKIPLAESLSIIAKQGYQRLYIEGAAVRVEEAVAKLGASQPAALDVIQDRFRLTGENRARFVEACEQAYHFGQGKLTVMWPATGQTRRFSKQFHCAQCDLEYREPSPGLFSFNNPVGACPTCRGFGRTIQIAYELAIPDWSLTLAGGAVKPWQTGTSAECQDDLMKFCRRLKVPTDVPFEKLPKKWQRWVIDGDPDYGKDPAHEWPNAWYGVKGYFRWLESKTYKMHVRVLLSRYRSYRTCADCGGKRFQPEALLFRVPWPGSTRESSRNSEGARSRPLLQTRPRLAPADLRSSEGRPASLTLADFYQLSVAGALQFVSDLRASHERRGKNDPATVVLDEVEARLRYLHEVGLGYLTLDRPTRTLSGGETERVTLTTCLGSRLVNTLFVLDEPSVGLHPHDTDQLVRILERLRNHGNTVVVVEHEPSVMRAADEIIDLGPGHGEAGGAVVFQGKLADLLKSNVSLTGQYLGGKKTIPIPERRPVFLSHDHSLGKRSAGSTEKTPSLRIAGASLHNLKDLAVEIPLTRFVCVTGVSGSGKTTLIREIVWPLLEAKLNGTKRRPLETDAPEDENYSHEADSPLGVMEGAEQIDEAVLVDQSPLGRTPRSNPAVYVGAFDHIRELFAASEEAQKQGLSASAFSFNSAQGQCERCRGAGFEKIEMQFLSDVYVRCPECQGRRYRPHILEVRLPGPAPTTNSAPSESNSPSGWTIADLLEATVDEVVAWLEPLTGSKQARLAAAKLRYLQEVGLGYLRLGQPINTLSGGESQRLKLVSRLATLSSEAAAGRQRALFLFDEPTTGLHFDDVRVLVAVFQKLVAAGHSVLVIEHNLELIKCADWLIDLGPEAGEAGGRVVVCGPPEVVAACEASHTGKALRQLPGFS